MKDKKLKITLKSFFILIVSLIALILIFFLFNYINNYFLRINEMQNVSSIKETKLFEISKITLFSSADATLNNNTNKASWNLNISQFTDIGIFIDNHSENGFSKENTISKLYIDNICYTNVPTLGTPNLYYKNPNSFGKLSFKEDYKISNFLEYTIIPYEQQIDFENPYMYDTNPSPICIEFVNQDIKTSYTLSDIAEPLRYDGSLLRRCNIGLTSISCSFSFDIHIVNQLGKHFKSTVTIDIPLKDENSNKTIYDGYLKQDILNVSDFKFYEL